MKAIIIGATGLVGHNILEQLLARADISEIVVFVRRTTGKTHPKLKEHIIEFEKIASWKHLIQGDILFSALGTTIKVAGTKEAQYRIDHDYQLFVALAAAANSVKSYVLISSVNASSRSSFFYLRMKGELEDKVLTLDFHSISILRPGPLKGHREHPRTGEIISTGLLKLIPFIPSGMKPVDGSRVAEVAIREGLRMQKGLRVLLPKDIL